MIRQAQTAGSTAAGQVVRGEGPGLEPDVPFPENRHVMSLRLSGAPSLAHQPERGHSGLTAHLAVDLGGGGERSPAWDPGPGFREAGKVALPWPVLCLGGN